MSSQEIIAVLDKLREAIAQRPKGDSVRSKLEEVHRDLRFWRIDDAQGEMPHRTQLEAWGILPQPPAVEPTDAPTSGAAAGAVGDTALQLAGSGPAPGQQIGQQDALPTTGAIDPGVPPASTLREQGYELLERGEQVTDNSGAVYEVDGGLSKAGSTAEVYLAHEVQDPVEGEEHRRVALKVLRPRISQKLEASYWHEVTVLGELALLEEQAADGAASVPRVYSQQKVGQHQFLVMELIEGQPLDRLLEHGPRPELDALEIAAQVLQVLHLLHIGARRTYTDFQLKNIWWQPGTRSVKIMDWNHVSPQCPKDKPLPVDWGSQDLLRFGAYFYYMLTGKRALVAGETALALQNRAGKRWESISLGSRRLVLRALHPNPGQRFSSAQVFLEAVRKHLGRLVASRPADDLLDEVHELLARGQQGGRVKDPEAIEEARVRLDLARRKGADERGVTRAQSHLDEMIKGISAQWAVGGNYYESNQLQEAARHWEAEAEALGRVDRWRWVMLAQAGAEMGGEVFSTAKSALEAALSHMKKENWDTAAARLHSIHPSGGPGLEALRAEAEAHRAAQLAHERIRLEGGRGDPVLLGEAAGNLGVVEKALERIQPPLYRDLLRREYGWEELPDHIKDIRKRAADLRQVNAKVKEIREKLGTDFSGGVAELEATLRQHPANSALIELACHQARQGEQAGRLQQAETLLSAVLHWGQAGDQETELRKRRNQIRTARLQKTIQQETADQVKAIREETSRKAQGVVQAKKLEMRQLEEAHAEAGRIALAKFRQAMAKQEWTRLADHAASVPVPEHHLLAQELKPSFESAMRDRLLPLALQLAGTLAVLDPGGQAGRQRRLDEIRRETKREYAAWRSGFEQRIVQLRGEGKYQKAASGIQTLLSTLSAEDESKRLELEDSLREMNSLGEAKKLLDEGLQMLAGLEAAKVTEARAHFGQANKLLGSLEKGPPDLLQRAEGCKLLCDAVARGIRHLDLSFEYLEEDEARPLLQRLLGGKAKQEQQNRAMWEYRYAVELTRDAWHTALGQPPPSLPRLEDLRRRIEKRWPGELARPFRDVPEDKSGHGEREPERSRLCAWLKGLGITLATILALVTLAFMGLQLYVIGKQETESPGTIIQKGLNELKVAVEQLAKPGPIPTEVEGRLSAAEEGLNKTGSQLDALAEYTKTLELELDRLDQRIKELPTPVVDVIAIATRLSEPTTPVATVEQATPTPDVRTLPITVTLVGSEPFYDLPKMDLAPQEGWTGWTVQADGELTAVDPNDAIWTLQLVANDVVQAGSAITTDAQTGAVVWTPDKSDPPLPAGTYQVSWRAQSTAGPAVTLVSDPVSLTVQPITETTTLLKAGCRSEPQTRIVLIDPEPSSGDLEVMGWIKTKDKNGAIDPVLAPFLYARVTGTRTICLVWNDARYVDPLIANPKALKEIRWWLGGE